jgi:hypothetical protein
VAGDWERIPPDTFDATETYAAGARVLASNRIYRALVSGPSTDLDDGTQWQQVGLVPNQYVTAADALAPRPEVFDLDLGAGSLPEALVRLRRLGEAAVVWARTFTADPADPGATLDRVQLDLRGLAPGAYHLEVLDAASALLPELGFDLYLGAAAVRGGWLGVIEILPGAGDMALLDGDGALRSPRFSLRFLNRASRWRYRFPSAQALGDGAEVAPEAGDARTLVTDRPRPITRYGDGVRLQADDPLTPEVSEQVRLPLPEVQRIRHQSAQWYSDIYLSNLPI